MLASHGEECCTHALCCPWTAIGHLSKERNGGVAAIVCATTGKNSATRVLLHLSRDGGGYFGRVAKWKSTLDVAPTAPGDEGRSCHRRPLEVSYRSSFTLKTVTSFN